MAAATAMPVTISRRQLSALLALADTTQVCLKTDGLRGALRIAADGTATVESRGSGGGAGRVPPRPIERIVYDRLVQARILPLSLEGELIPRGRDGAEFHIFEAASIGGGFTQRMAVIRALGLVQLFLPPSPLWLVPKRFVPLNLAYFLLRSIDVADRVDGLVFTPERTEARIIKWKPLDHQTVDLVMRAGGSTGARAGVLGPAARVGSSGARASLTNMRTHRFPEALCSW